MGVFEGLEPHDSISEVATIDGQIIFPIHWTNIQVYCEYQIYLEYFRGVDVGLTEKMVEGRRQHDKKLEEFKESPFLVHFESRKEMIEESKEDFIIAREFRVLSRKYGIMGRIDELDLEPDRFTVYDDKRMQVVFPSHKNQVFAYCLALSDILGDDKRPIYGVVRNTETQRVLWEAEFDNVAKAKTIDNVKRLHDLIENRLEWGNCDNPNKCKKCRFNKVCERRLR